MNPRKILLLTILLTVFSSSAWAKKYEGLKVIGDYKTLRVVVESFKNYESVRITKEDVERTVKLRLLANGIKTTDKISPHYLYVKTQIMPIKIGERVAGYAVKTDCELIKFAYNYKIPTSFVGRSFLPDQGEYGGLGIKPKENIISQINSSLDKFLLDYLESNVK